MCAVPCVNIGQREKDMLADVTISPMATPTSQGNSAPPYSAGNGAAFQPAST